MEERERECKGEYIKCGKDCRAAPGALSAKPVPRTPEHGAESGRSLHFINLFCNLKYWYSWRDHSPRRARYYDYCWVSGCRIVSGQDTPLYPPLGVLTILILSAPSPPAFLPLSCCSGRRVRPASASRTARSQGLTLVHFSAQPEPFLTQNTPLIPTQTAHHLLNSP